MSINDNANNDNDSILCKQHHLSVQENDESMLCAHSRDSSSSDISSDGAGYYNRLTRHANHASARDASYCSSTFVENSLLTRNNIKLVVSGVLWLTCYLFMGLFGGAVAYMHFQRVSQGDTPEPLPDFGYDIIPVSFEHECITRILQINYLTHCDAVCSAIVFIHNSITARTFHIYHIAMCKASCCSFCTQS